MNFQDIPAEIVTIRAKRTAKSTEALQEQTVFSVDASRTRPDEFEIRLKDSVVFVQPVVDADIRRLNFELAGNRAILAQLANPAADGSIELQIAFFTGECLEMGEVEIGVDEYVEKGIAKIERRKDGFKGKHLYRKLDQLCCFSQGDSAFFFLTAGPAIDGALTPEPAPKERADQEPENSNDAEETEVSEADAESDTVLGDATQTPRPEPTRKNSFCVTGDGIRFVATATPLPDGKSIFTITRLTKSRNEPDRALRLAKGRLAFVDWTQAGQIQILAKAQMTALNKDDGSYLKKWDEFGDLEGELLLKHAREVGAMQYCDMQQNHDGTVSVRITQAPDSAWRALAASGVPEIEAVAEVPDYLKNERLTFREFVGGIEKEEEEEEFPEKKARRQEAKPYFNVSDFDAEAQTITLATESVPMESGTLILSLAGEIAQIKRRMSARRSILEGRTANPQLGPLIEEKGRIASTRRPPKVRPLTAFVRDKIFRNPPTVTQEKAIEVALNTPDIALIQGPPGTGKTTVIAAILERLNELADKRGGSTKGRVLLTGFQHDAVENMIARLSLNSIPVPKFGKRSGADDDDFDAFEKSLDEWCGKRAAELRERNPQIAEIERETEIKNLCMQYVRVPTRTLAANLAGQIAALGVRILGEDGARWAANLVKKLSREERLNDEFNPLLDAVRRLRIRPESFADDGPERATDALDDLKADLEQNDFALLNRATLWSREDGTPRFLKDLEALKKKLLIRFANPPLFRVEKQNDEVIALAEEAIKCIMTAGHSAQDVKSAALAEFLAELESNPYGMIDAVSDYSFAFAATCQQSVNRQMQYQKGITGNDPEQKIIYDFVIVDEAARVSPRDLMIPMAQGKRIILVGDHRQLPHIIDDEVARQMEQGETGQEESDWLKKSMFQYLFSERLKTLEENDGVTRRVTLDKQYRMHPDLGKFVSRNFYERFDPSEQFGSGKLESDFVHNLPDTHNRPAAWLDVPVAKGWHLKCGTSWTRPAEAAAIAWQLQAWINSAEGLCSSLTFSRDDFADLLSLATKLRQPSRSVDAWLTTQLSDQTQAELAAYDGQNLEAARLQPALEHDLNRLLKQSSVYERTRFGDVALRPAIESLLSQPPQGDNLVRLNRLLIEDAYPLELRRNPLSFGVISFYKAQAELIKTQLGEITSDGKTLRIGTVDSFQGMEFDVVFLSMVRTLPQNWKPRDDNHEKQARGLFGHLCLYNRLNVSMSRQKKLLVVAGDSGLLQSKLAAEFIPGLVDFRELCQREGTILQCR